MPLTPAFEPGLCNGWLFVVVFPLQWLAVLVLPGRFVARTGHPADLTQGRKAEIMSVLTQFFWIGATLYSIFLPLRTGTPWFTGGLLIFVGGLTLLVFATLSVARTEPEEPFMGGVYRYSSVIAVVSRDGVHTIQSLSHGTRKTEADTPDENPIRIENVMDKFVGFAAGFIRHDEKEAFVIDEERVEGRAKLRSGVARPVTGHILLENPGVGGRDVFLADFPRLR